jgi:hypothetical protein
MATIAARWFTYREREKHGLSQIGNRADVRFTPKKRKCFGMAPTSAKRASSSLPIGLRNSASARRSRHRHFNFLLFTNAARTKRRKHDSSRLAVQFRNPHIA